jgi:hypothetical protein
MSPLTKWRGKVRLGAKIRRALQQNVGDLWIAILAVGSISPGEGWRFLVFTENGEPSWNLPQRWGRGRVKYVPVFY